MDNIFWLVIELDFLAKGYGFECGPMWHAKKRMFCASMCVELRTSKQEAMASNYVQVTFLWQKVMGLSLGLCVM